MAELFKQAVKVIFLAVCLHVAMVQASLSCLSCSNVQKISDCATTVQCPEYHNCFTRTFGVIGNLTFNLGCKPIQDCLTLNTDSTMIGKRQSAIGEAHCHQCCGLNNCNRDICSNFTTYLSSNDSCLDSPDINCHTLSQVTNICADVEHAKLICKQFCGLCLLVDGGWSSWSTWSSCDVTCDNGHMTRTRTCSIPVPQYGGHSCVGSAVDSMSCHFSRHCPVDGSWSVWQPWGTCSTTCGIGLKTRMRTCISPSPSHQGRQCLGDVHQSDLCTERTCAVDGGWSVWQPWDTCSKSCGVGLKTRMRTCSSPSPSNQGHQCLGDVRQSDLCTVQTCAVDGGWSVWQPWGTCSKYCGVGLKTRMRTCSSPTPSHQGRQCLGDVHQLDVCTERNCPDVRLVNGNNTNEGRVEVFHNGVGGTVCDDFWSAQDAKVVCRMLGKPYTNAVAYQDHQSHPRFGPGSGSILMDDVQCTGTETHLFDCPFGGWGINNCSHREDAGVSCQ